MFSALIHSFNDRLLMLLPHLPLNHKKFDSILFVHPRSSLEHNKTFRGWRIYKLKDTMKNDRLTARWVKLQIHNVLEKFNYDYSVWIDSNLSLKPSFFPWILKIIDESYFFHFISLSHPERKCIHDEILYCERRGIIDREVGDRIKLTFSDFPKKMGLFETKMVIRCHLPKVDEMGDRWWEIVRDVCIRDQCSLMPILLSSSVNHLAISKKEFTKHAKEKKIISQSRLVPGHTSSLLRF